MKATLLPKDQKIKITFLYDPSTVEKIRSLPERRWYPEGKYWTCHLQIDALKSLKSWGFALDENLEEILAKNSLHISQVQEINVPNLKGNLYPFQKQGVSFIEQKGGRVLIADEMGLGKTIQTLAWLQLHTERRPAIIICPASVKLLWKREAEAWIEEVPIILSGSQPKLLTDEKIIILNYDILPTWIETLKEICPQVLVLDECHYIKNRKAKRTRAALLLGKTIPHILALSGTPIVNRPIEAYNTIKLISPHAIPNFWNYTQRYCAAYHNRFGWDFSGASNTEELHEKLTNSIMIRRKKVDVLKDLPQKIRSFIPLEIENEEEYKKAENDFISWLTEKQEINKAERAKRAEHLVKIEALKQLATTGKMKLAIEWISDYLETNGKLVVFATHRDAVRQLMESFKAIAIKVDGSTSLSNREKAIHQFQNNESIRLFAGNIKTAGIGITLTAASSVAFLELGWTPGEMDQAEDRIHRIGQEATSVNVYYLLATGTIEEKIARLLDHKRKILDKVLDGKETEEESLLAELIKEYQQKKKKANV